MLMDRPRPARPRRRADDLRSVAALLLAQCGTIWTSDRREAAEIGACLQVRDVAAHLDLPREEIRPSGFARHSPEQLVYVRGLLEDVPKLVASLAVV